MSPILVRPVREQLEHDRLIRLLQAKYKRKFETAINPGNEQNAGVGGPPPWFPDRVLQASDKNHKLLGVVEVETTESINHLEAMSQWGAFSRLRVPFHLYVPGGMVDSARRLCADLQVTVGELWSYNAFGDQIRFTLVQRIGPALEPKTPPKTTAPKTAPKTPPKTAAPKPVKAAPARPAASRSRPVPAARRPAAAAAPRRKPVALKAKSAPARRGAAKAAPKPGPRAARPQKRR